MLTLTQNMYNVEYQVVHKKSDLYVLTWKDAPSISEKASKRAQHIKDWSYGFKFHGGWCVCMYKQINKIHVYKYAEKKTNKLSTEVTSEK